MSWPPPMLTELVYTPMSTLVELILELLVWS